MAADTGLPLERKLFFLNKHIAANGFLQPGLIYADASIPPPLPHLSVQSSRAVATCSGPIPGAGKVSVGTSVPWDHLGMGGAASFPLHQPAR